MKHGRFNDYFTCLDQYTNTKTPPPLDINDFYYLKAGCLLIANQNYQLKEAFYSRLLNAAGNGRIYGKLGNKFLLLTTYFAGLIPANEVLAIENIIKNISQFSSLKLT
jgi:hypothetical protein